MTTDDVAKSLESGHGEATSSIAWLPGQSSCLAAGMGNRFLRIFDTREGGGQSRPVQVANHKAILGLSVCPALPHQLASYAEGSTVFIWDLRHFGKPVGCFYPLPISVSNSLYSDLLLHSVRYHREVVMVTDSSRLPEYCIQGTPVPSPR
jgi:WD40 repeat protein